MELAYILSDLYQSISLLKYDQMNTELKIVTPNGLLSVCWNTSDFVHWDLFYDFDKIICQSRSIFTVSLGFSMYKIMSSMASFISFILFPICVSLVFFVRKIVLARTSSTIMDRRDKRECVFFVPQLWGKIHIMSLSIRYDVSIVISKCLKKSTWRNVYLGSWFQRLQFIVGGHITLGLWQGRI